MNWFLRIQTTIGTEKKARRSFDERDAMNWKRIYPITLSLLLIVGGVSAPAFSQAQKDSVISFSGVIEQIPREGRFLIINEARIYLSPATQITDERGSTLNRGELKLNLNVTVQAIRTQDGLVAEKIVVKGGLLP